ncbi:hypothetical protein AC625_05490 [Peribacillus loiseleuriae]|uniref:Uncharacterized protein n=1 Tax=Peribacillus loiseleuriae TaxID=1679170 RepID=A0A0K9GQW8_9BACI|nr:hypothetical protein [Peribacillus loiseleuriae]KMY49028.1 hypothetical protein AC625_05490 [Peribacillus loiseleuriae]
MVVTTNPNVTGNRFRRASSNGSTLHIAAAGIKTQGISVPLPDINNAYFGVNDTSRIVPLKNRVNKIINIYKNGTVDTFKWIKQTNLAYGNERATIAKADFDSTAEYTVSYIALDKEKFTVNPVSVPVSWAGSFKAAFNDLLNEHSDIATTVRVNSKLIYDMLVRMKAGGI